jgi:hypothetical protein
VVPERLDPVLREPLREAQRPDRQADGDGPVHRDLRAAAAHVEDGDRAGGGDPAPHAGERERRLARRVDDLEVDPGLGADSVEERVGVGRVAERRGARGREPGGAVLSGEGREPPDGGGDPVHRGRGQGADLPEPFGQARHLGLLAADHEGAVRGQLADGEEDAQAPDVPEPRRVREPRGQPGNARIRKVAVAA